MASFLGKINRMRNLRLHAANEYIYPNASLYHEIVQGIPWTGGFSRVKPRRINTHADKLLSYVMKKRPIYRSYAWCPPDNGGVYVHPGVWTSERMQHHLDNNPHMNMHEAFDIADKEMSERKAELDLQVSLAREHAARLGVSNQGVTGLFKRASILYESVYDMRHEEGEKRRNAELADLCQELAARNERLDLQDILEIMPFKEEQMQFFKDFPEYRELFPPLWYITEEVVQAQARETSQRTGEPIRAEKQDTFVEEDPSGNLVDQWPPKYIFDRENRNNEKAHIKDGLSLADSELLVAKQEALKYKIKEFQKSQTKSSEYEPEEGESVGRAAFVVDDATAESIISEAEALGENLFNEEQKTGDILAQTMKDNLHISQTMKEENSDFYVAYHAFLNSNSRDKTKKIPESNDEYQKVLSERDRLQSEEILKVAAKYLASGKGLDAEAIAALRSDIRGQYGEAVEDSLFEIAEGGGAVNPREFSGLAPFDEFANRTVDLTSNLELTPFFPENAFPPRGITADLSLNLKDTASLTKEQQEQLESLKAFGAKYAHAIEDHAPVKSKEYIEESLKWGVPVVSEHMPAPKTSLEAQAKELLAVKKSIEQEGEPKTLEEFRKQEASGEAEAKTSSSVEINTDAALKAIKQQMLDDLASKAFSSEEERKDYEHMLEKRYDYLVAKKKEVYEQWAQYWPSDKPEALIYRGPETIREIFPEAYRLAVNRQYEELTGLPINEGLTVKTYSGLWKSVRGREKADPKIRDLDEEEWQHKIELDPAYYKTSTTTKKE